MHNAYAVSVPSQKCTCTRAMKYEPQRKAAIQLRKAVLKKIVHLKIYLGVHNGWYVPSANDAFRHEADINK